ncbi:response regulator [Elusimicrobiota bacterium]
MNIVSPVKVLLVEDNPDHRELIKKHIVSSEKKYSIEETYSGKQCLKKLAEKNYNVILLDYSLPRMNGLEVLDTINEQGFDIPVIIITGLGDEKIAVEAMKKGAYDYITKSDGYLTTLPHILKNTLERHSLKIERKQAEEERSRLIEELQESLAKIKTLSGLLPICTNCKKIRDDKGYWSEVETYVKKHSEVMFSHGFCPECGVEEIERIKNELDKKG